VSTHRHNYQMVFDENSDHPFDYKLLCSCGDVAPDMQTAMRRMRAPNLEVGTVLAVGLLGAGAALFVFALCLTLWR